MNRFYTFSGFIAGILGGIILLLFYFLLHNSVLISLISGLVGYIGVYSTMYALRPKDELSIGLGNPVKEAELNRTLKQGADQVKLLQYYKTQVTDVAVKGKLDRISGTVEDIFTIFKKDPNDIKYARQFLSYYLDTTLRIIKKYSELASQRVYSPQMKATLIQAEKMLDSIAVAFEKQKEKLLSNDIMDLDVEIQTLEKTFNAEDLK